MRTASELAWGLCEHRPSRRARIHFTSDEEEIVRKTVAVLAVAALGVTAPAVAQAADPDTTVLRNAVNRAEVLRYAQRLQSIGMANENQRLTASQGNYESLDFVVTELRKMGYSPTLVPYANTSAPNAWSERTPGVLEQTAPTADAKTFVNNLNNTGDFAQMSWSRSADITAQVIPVNRITIPPVGALDGTRAGCAMSDFPAAVKDNIALVQRGGCNFVEKAINARASGAKAVFIMNEGQTGRTAPGTGTGFTRVANQRYPGYVGATLSYATGKRFYDAYQAGTPATVHFKTDNNLTQRIDYDIIAETTTGDPNRIVQVGAHIDGVAAGPGINDDGSGTAMNLAIANQLKKTGIQTKYRVRFGWFSGEEQGLFGSNEYANQIDFTSADMVKFAGMLDYDMLASTNYIPFVYVPNPNIACPCPPAADEAILGGLHNDYLKQKLNIDSTQYPVDNRSDYAGFRSRTVPATGLYTGAETPKTAEQVAKYGGQATIQADPCYHEWCDTVFNLSEYGLNEFTDVLAHGVLSFAGVGNDAVELSVRQDN